MEADIKKETDDGFGLTVYDNDGVEHKIGVCFTGDIDGHLQDAYPDDPAERTSSQSVRIRQAQEYAKYYVQREQGYRTLSPHLTPEWLPYTLGAVFGLDSEAFEEYFGPYVQQYHSAIRPNIDPVVELPDENAPIGGIVYRMDIYLGMDFDSYLSDPAGASPVDAVGEITDAYDLYEALTAELQSQSIESVIEETSAVDVQYQRRAADGSVQEPTVGERSATTSGQPDGQLQMTPPQTTIESDLSTEIIQGLLCHHLQCQIRDSYIRLGVEPPEAVRVLGQGLAEQTMHYQHADIHPPYHLTDAEIDGYRPPGVETDALADGTLGGSSRKSVVDHLKRALFGG